MSMNAKLAKSSLVAALGRAVVRFRYGGHLRRHRRNSPPRTRSRPRPSELRSPRRSGGPSSARCSAAFRATGTDAAPACASPACCTSSPRWAAPSPLDWSSLLVARFIGGLGIGASSVLGPMYIAEIAPAKQRGRLVGFFQFNIVFGILLAYFSNYVLGTMGFGECGMALEARDRGDSRGGVLPAAVSRFPESAALAGEQGPHEGSRGGPARHRRSGVSARTWPRSPSRSTCGTAPPMSRSFPRKYRVPDFPGGVDRHVQPVHRHQCDPVLSERHLREGRASRRSPAICRPWRWAPPTCSSRCWRCR